MDVLTIGTQWGVFPEQSWLHVHVTVVGQGQGLLRRGGRLRRFGRLTVTEKKRAVIRSRKNKSDIVAATKTDGGGER